MVFVLLSTLPPTHWKFLGLGNNCSGNFAYILMLTTNCMCVSHTVLLNVILVDNSDGLLECTRVYGNLSRYPGVRKIIVDNKGTTLYSQHTLHTCAHALKMWCACTLTFTKHTYPFCSHYYA